MVTFFNIRMKKVTVKWFSMDFCDLKGQNAIKKMVKTFACKLLVHCLAFLIHISNSIRKNITASVRPLYTLL